jgi:predicted dehydrogenase
MTPAPLDAPLAVALVGAGNRSRTIYLPLFRALQPWVRVVAVCDPVREHADGVAATLGVPAFYSLRDLVAARPMEAALVVTPIEGHHAMSCYLSSHGVHNLVETTMASLLTQAREMADAAREHGVVMRVAENFFRFPFDRIARKIVETGVIGPVGRLTCFHDHLGYHNNSRWIVMMGSYPESVQAVRHTMATLPYDESPQRHHESETFQARFFVFPGDRLVSDIAGNIKGMLGRYPRPGYTEFDGTRGAIARWPTRPWWAEAEVRVCSDEALANGAIADGVYPIVHEAADGFWSRDYVDLPSGRVEWVNPFSPKVGLEPGHVYHHRDYYGAAVMDHIVDFARAVRGVAASEYTDEAAVMAMMMEVGARESVLRDGARVTLPLSGDLESEQLVREQLQSKLGVDPLDIEAVMEISFPRP